MYVTCHISEFFARVFINEHPAEITEKDLWVEECGQSIPTVKSFSLAAIISALSPLALIPIYPFVGSLILFQNSSSAQDKE